MDPVLHPTVVATAKKMGVETLTPVQKKAIPAILAGKDALVVAPTGFGKTEAAIIPVFSELKKRMDAGDSWGIQAVYVTPLRALNRDILLRLEKWCSELGITLAVRHGDTPQSQRRKQRDAPPQFLITTPETLSAILVSPQFSNALYALRALIIDEYHELLEGKRGLQLGLAISRLRKKSGYPLQLIGLSATIGDAQAAAKTISPKAIAIESDENRGLELSVEHVERKTAASPSSDAGKTGPLEQKVASLVLSHRKTLVFCNTRSNAEWLGSRLHRISSDYPAALKDKIAVHHSSLSAAARKETEEAFKRPEGLRAIVCTSSLELGIDIGDVDLVIQVVSPRQAVRLLQRVGRSGHRTHLVPRGIILSHDALDCAESACVCAAAKGGRLESAGTQRPALDVLAHQMAGATLDNFEKQRQVSLAELRNVLSNCPAYAYLPLATYFDVALELSKRRVLGLVLPQNLLPNADENGNFGEEALLGKAMLRRMPRTLLYYYENLSTIDDKKSLRIRNASSNRHMGVLDEEFAAQYLGNGTAFISRGKPWRVLSVSDDEVVVEESDDYSAAIPEWRGEEIPVSAEIAKDVCELLMHCAKGDAEAVEKKYSVSNDAAQKIIGFAREQETAFAPSAGEILLENLPNGRVALHCFLGDRFNEAFAIALDCILRPLKAKARFRPGSYGMLIEFENPGWDAEKLCRVISGLAPETLAFSLKKGVPESKLVRVRFAHIAKRFGMVSCSLAVSNRGAFLRGLLNRSRGGPAFREAQESVLVDKLGIGEFEKLYAGLRAGNRTRVSVVNSARVSPLAKAMMDSAQLQQPDVQAEPDEKAVEEFVSALKSKTARLFCTFCLSRISKQLSESWDGKFSCPRCGSTQIATEEYEEIARGAAEKEKRKTMGDEPAPSAFNAKSRNKKRNVPTFAKASGTAGSSKKKISAMHAVASMVSTYGMRAVIALSAFGVGPETAARILGRMHKSEDDFFYDLLAAQKTFIRTRQYWKL
jgi:ATP-dependent Lhr-like helicase